MKLDITNVCHWMVYTNRIDRSIYTINICYEEPQSINYCSDRNLELKHHVYKIADRLAGNAVHSSC
jgi:hypothetical protein